MVVKHMVAKNNELKKQIKDFKQCMEGKNKEIENKSKDIQNKNKQITNLKIKMRDFENKFIKKDLKVNQVKAASQFSKAKVEDT